MNKFAQMFPEHQHRERLTSGSHSVPEQKATTAIIPSTVNSLSVRFFLSVGSTPIGEEKNRDSTTLTEATTGCSLM